MLLGQRDLKVQIEQQRLQNAGGNFRLRPHWLPLSILERDHLRIGRTRALSRL